MDNFPRFPPVIPSKPSEPGRRVFLSVILSKRSAPKNPSPGEFHMQLPKKTDSSTPCLRHSAQNDRKMEKANSISVVLSKPQARRRTHISPEFHTQNRIPM